MSEFTCRSERIDDSCVVVVCTGEIDLFTCHLLESTFADLQNAGQLSRVVVDLSDVDFMDSAGLSVLIVRQRQAEEPLRIVIIKPHLMRLFTVSGLDRVFSIHTSRAGAIASLAC
jgi:anti-sigma B factor antagonist